MAEGKAKRMWALPGAEFTANAAAMMHGGSLETFQMPVPCYLIEHPKGPGAVRHRLLAADDR